MQSSMSSRCQRCAYHECYPGFSVLCTFTIMFYDRLVLYSHSHWFCLDHCERSRQNCYKVAWSKRQWWRNHAGPSASVKGKETEESSDKDPAHSFCCRCCLVCSLVPVACLLSAWPCRCRGLLWWGVWHRFKGLALPEQFLPSWIQQPSGEGWAWLQALRIPEYEQGWHLNSRSVGNPVSVWQVWRRISHAL